MDSYNSYDSLKVNKTVVDTHIANNTTMKTPEVKGHYEMFCIPDGVGLTFVPEKKVIFNQHIEIIKYHNNGSI
jgi:hypothetical protein